MISCCWMPEAANPVRDARRGSGWTSSEVKRQLCSGQKVTIMGSQLSLVSCPATSKSEEQTDFSAALPIWQLAFLRNGSTLER